MREEHSEIPSSDGYTYTPLVCNDGLIIPAQMPCQQVSASSAKLTKFGSLERLRLTFGRPSDRLYQLRGYGGKDALRAQGNEQNDLGMEAATSPEPRNVMAWDMYRLIRELQSRAAQDATSSHRVSLRIQESHV